jgi:hypothetical protein
MSEPNVSWPKGPRVAFQFPAGTPCRAEESEHARLLCHPFANRSGCQWFHFCVRVEGLRDGQELTLDVEWPPIRSADQLPDADAETLRRETEYDSFAKVLPRICLLSADLWSFSPAHGVELTGERTVSVPLLGTGRDLYLATQMPYTPARHAALLAEAERAEPGCVHTLGLSQAGLEVSTVRLEADAGSDAPTVYIQAYQHITEFSGPLIAEAMIRHLLAGGPGRELRRNVTFHITPAVDVDAVFYGPSLALDPRPSELRKKNPNRDWQDLTWPEVRAIDGFLRSEVAGGRRYVAGLDLHNGWHMADDSGANYTVSTVEDAGEKTVAEQKAFIDHMLSRTDHERVGNYWQHAAGGRTFKSYFQRLTGVSLAHTVEFSRHLWWNRRKQAYEPYAPHHPEQFARQATAALAEFFG